MKFANQWIIVETTRSQQTADEAGTGQQVTRRIVNSQNIQYIQHYEPVGSGPSATQERLELVFANGERMTVEAKQVTKFLDQLQVAAEGQSTAEKSRTAR